jgi:choline dehydrogenase-like flavoprotein
MKLLGFLLLLGALALGFDFLTTTPAQRAAQKAAVQERLRHADLDTAARAEVRRHLKAPRTAKFSEVLVRDAGQGVSIVSGVVDSQSRLFGYRNFLVCDGSTVPANPGVNPSLTITAMSERAMALR